MNRWAENKRLWEELKEIARKYNVPIICAKQEPRPDTYHVSRPPPQVVLIVDDLSLLR